MSFWLRPGNFPIVAGHRGSPGSAPENTIASFRRAVEEGADAVELDVRMTKDERVVVIHDSRLGRTTDGSGYVSNKLFSQIRELSAGGWYGKSYSSEKIPTLEEVFENLGGKTGLNIEIKTGRRLHRRFKIVELCCDLVKEYKAEKIVLISSFSCDYIARVRSLHPGIATGLLCGRICESVKSRLTAAESAGADYLIFNGKQLTEKVVRLAHGADMLVGVYGADGGRRSERALLLGVDAVITDFPSHLKSLPAYRKKVPVGG